MMLSGPIAVSGLGATTEEAEEEEILPSSRQIRAKYDYYLALAPDNKLPADENDEVRPEDAIEWGVQALENYERKEGKRSSSSFKTKIATAGEFKGINFNERNVGVAAQVLGDISGAAGSKYWEVGATTAVVTADRLRDGKLTQREAESMGTAVGAVAGAAICQSIGVPAPIGAVVGGKVGGGAAEMIHYAFAGKSTEQLQKAREAKVRAALNHFRFDAVTACEKFELEYWKQVDEFVRNYAIAWTQAEQQIGWRFGLRWFDPTSDNAFRYKWDKSKGRPSSARGIRTDTRATYDCKPVTISTTKGDVHDKWCSSRCSVTYGCPYPNLYQGVSGGPTPTHVVNEALENGIRVIHALGARGVLWLPPHNRPQGDWERRVCDDYIYAPPSQAYGPAEDQIRRQYKDDVRGRLRVLDEEYRKFIRARTWLQADLTRTASIVGTEHDLWVNKSRYITQGAGGGAVKAAVDQAKLTSNLVSGFALLGGASLLGYALYRGLK